MVDIYCYDCMCINTYIYIYIMFKPLILIILCCNIIIVMMICCGNQFREQTGWQWSREGNILCLIGVSVGRWKVWIILNQFAKVNACQIWVSVLKRCSALFCFCVPEISRFSNITSWECLNRTRERISYNINFFHWNVIVLWEN